MCGWGSIFDEQTPKKSAMLYSISSIRSFICNVRAISTVIKIVTTLLWNQVSAAERRAFLFIELSTNRICLLVPIRFFC